MSKRDDFDDFFGDDDDAPLTDTRADGRLYRVPLARLAPNLVNPRRDFGTQDQLIDFGKSLARRQNQPCPVVSRTAYLKLWPDHRDHIGEVDYVLVSGERRYRAGTAVGLAALDCVANDDTARDRKTFMEAVVSENVDRRNFDPIEEAYAVQSLVSEFGSNRAVAQHFERVDGWVTQRILLTHLAPEVQGLVREKSIPLEVARSLGKIARDKSWGAREQIQWWEEEQGRRSAAAVARAAARKEARKEARQTPPAPAPAAAPAPVQPQPPSFTAVKPPEDVPETPPSFTAVKQPALPEARPDTAMEETGATPKPETIPEPRADEASANGKPSTAELAGERRQVKMPWGDGVACAEIAISKMVPAERNRMAERLLQQALLEKEAGGASLPAAASTS
jgi:ParB family chromosome partitioning protein